MDTLQGISKGVAVCEDGCDSFGLGTAASVQHVDLISTLCKVFGGEMTDKDRAAGDKNVHKTS